MYRFLSVHRLRTKQMYSFISYNLELVCQKDYHSNTNTYNDLECTEFFFQFEDGLDLKKNHP